jgi:coupling of ubiquitin conjugation to ER degradation protein 1
MSGRSGRAIDPRQVEAVAQMFPSFSRRDIMWDLNRNGGNIQMTIERLLGGRGLETVRLGFGCPSPNYTDRT